MNCHIFKGLNAICEFPCRVRHTTGLRHRTRIAAEPQGCCIETTPLNGRVSNAVAKRQHVWQEYVPSARRRNNSNRSSGGTAYQGRAMLTNARAALAAAVLLSFVVKIDQASAAAQ